MSFAGTISAAHPAQSGHRFRCLNCGAEFSSRRVNSTTQLAHLFILENDYPPTIHATGQIDVRSGAPVSQPALRERQQDNARMNRHSRNDPPPPGRAYAASENATARPATRRRQSSRPSYNPGLQKLVEGKKAWTEPLSDEAKAQGFLGWHQRGYIPHCNFPDVTQFVTLRLDDSMPASRRSEWEALLHLEDKRERRTKLEEYLDRGFGECPLKQPAIAELVENALRFFDGQRYRLQAWVIMPNSYSRVGGHLADATG